MPNYSSFEPQRPFSSFIGGLGAGNQLQYSALRSQAMQSALEQQKLQRETAQQFQATGDPRVLRGYDPALAVTIENNLATMDTNKQQAAIKKLTAGIDITDKVLPYIVAASRSNPEEAANMWPDYIANLRNVGIQPPPFMEQYSPETLTAVLKQKEDIKTAVARINAASRLQTAEIGANARLGAAGIGADARLEAARIGAASRTANGGRVGSNRFPNFTDYLASVRRGEDSVLPANASYNQIMLQFSKNKTEGEAAGKAVYPKPLTPEQTMLDKAANPQKYGADGQLKPEYRPGGQSTSGVQRMLPSRDDPNKMIPATEEQYKAWHGIK